MTSYLRFTRPVPTQPSTGLMPTLILFALTLALGASAKGLCIHDDVQSRITVQRQAPQPHRAEASAIGPMRIVPVLNNLYDPRMYCTAVGEVKPTFRGTNATCTEDGILTNAKRDFVVNIIVPSLVTYFGNLFRVTQAVSAITVPQGTCQNGMIILPNATSPGFTDADYVLYVTAGQTAGSNIAFAGYCNLDQTDSRPDIGYINFGPNYLDSNRTDSQLRTAIHELLHALGFSYTYFTDYYPPGTIAQETRRGGNVSYITAAAVVTVARNYFNCSTLSGPELEDEGGSGTALSHWKRRSHYDDIMSGIDGESLMSNLTLAMMAASGKYHVNYSVAESVTWGKDAGCGFHSSTCNTTAGGLGREFCLSGTLVCDFNRRGIGFCEIGDFGFDLPPYQQYFAGYPQRGGTQPLMSYCPIVTAYSNNICNDKTGTNSTATAMIYSPSSRCIETSARFVRDGFTLPRDQPSRCMPIRCLASSLQIFVGSTWADCPSDGSAAVMSGTPYGYTGTFTCPTASTFCTVIPAPTTSMVPLTTADPTTTTTTTTTTSLTTTTTTARTTTTAQATATVRPTSTTHSTSTPTITTSNPITSGSPTTASAPRLLMLTILICIGLLIM